MKVTKLKSGKYSITDISASDRYDLIDALMLAAWHTNDVPAPTKGGKADPEFVAKKEKRCQRLNELKATLSGF